MEREMRSLHQVCAALDRAALDLQRVMDDPKATLAALSKAHRDYDLSRVNCYRCEWRLRAIAAHAVRKPPSRIGATVILGCDRAVRESLAILLGANGYGRPKALPFDDYDFRNRAQGQLLIVDVPPHSVTAAQWFVERFDSPSDSPYFIALAHPEDASSFNGKVHRVLPKPFALKVLLRTIDALEKAAAIPDVRRRTRSSYPANALPLPAHL